MKIAGLQKNSFVDYRGKVSAVVFTAGCNMDCFYCHNRGILCDGEYAGAVREEEVLELLARRRRFLDGVVVSGGEPTLQPDLEQFIAEVKDLGYPVKLDTNGTNPDKLRWLIDRDMVDFVAMDIKAPMARYGEVCGININSEVIEESIDLLMQERVDYEFRTTVVPELQKEDIASIAQRIKGAKLYILQQFRQPLAYKDVVDYRALKPPHKPAYLQEMSRMAGRYVRKNETRGVV